MNSIKFTLISHNESEMKSDLMNEFGVNGVDFTPYRFIHSPFNEIELRDELKQSESTIL